MVTNLAAQIVSAAFTAAVVTAGICLFIAIVRAAIGPRKPPGNGQ